jgi:hypothetical protein
MELFFKAPAKSGLEADEGTEVMEFLNPELTETCTNSKRMCTTVCRLLEILQPTRAMLARNSPFYYPWQEEWQGWSCSSKRRQSRV